MKLDFFHSFEFAFYNLFKISGRINQCQLQTLLNIDISHIEKKVAELVKNNSNLVSKILNYYQKKM